MISRARLTAMTKAAKPEVRREGVWRLTVRAQRRRSEPFRLLPLIRPLLDDPDEGVRAEVVHAFRRCGSAGLRYVDDVARVAARYPQVAGSTGFTPEYYATHTLIRLADARWVDIVGAVTVRPHPNLLPDVVPRNPPVLKMEAVEAIPRLEKLANQDKRLVDSGVDDDIVWDDEALRLELKAATVPLRSCLGIRN